MNKEVFDLIERERSRQESEICLIASENYTSEDVMKAQGSVLTNKYAEGYPDHRYYGGCSVVDEIENLAKDKLKKLFNCNYVNVQPHSGSQANQAVYLALLKPGDTLLGMSLDAGGHLTHGSKVSSSGKIYKSISYGLDDNGIINYNEIKDKLYEYNPKLLIVGASAYSREIDFKRIREIVDDYNNIIFEECLKINITAAEELFNNKKCLIMVDMAHIAGLVAANLHQSPIPYADAVTSTTHKTLRGPRGGIILTNNEEIAKKIDKAVFPGNQGGPLMHVIAAKAVCFDEALKSEFKIYQQNILNNIKAMERVFKDNNINMVSGGSDNHLILLDLRSKGISGKQLEHLLEQCNIIVNKNAVKDDPLPKVETSGIRIGTAAITTRGADEEDCKWVASIICNCIKMLTNEYSFGSMSQYDAIILIKQKIINWCKDHPIYKGEN